MLTILSLPEIQTAIATLVIAMLVALTAWVKKEKSKEDFRKDDFDSDMLKQLTIIANSLKSLASDFHDYLIILKYAKNSDSSRKGD